jgi:hypothetical protein
MTAELGAVHSHGTGKFSSSLALERRACNLNFDSTFIPDLKVEAMVLSSKGVTPIISLGGKGNHGRKDRCRRTNAAALAAFISTAEFMAPGLSPLVAAVRVVSLVLRYQHSILVNDGGQVVVRTVLATVSMHSEHVGRHGAKKPSTID